MTYDPHAYAGLRLASDISKRLAANRLESTIGTGPGGIVTAADVARFKASTPAERRAGVAAAQSRAAQPPTHSAPRASAAPATPATVSALALKLAVQAERDAIGKLFGHAGAKARIVGLCTRLASGKSAATLLAELNAGTIIADDRLRAIVAETVQASASAIWDKAYDRAFGKAAPVAPVSAKASAAWDGAIANVSRGMARN